MRRIFRVDLLAGLAAVLALLMVVTYVSAMAQQGDRPATWFLAALVMGATAAGYGAHPGAPHRRVVLLAAALELSAAGVLAIVSIGLPILLAGMLCLLAGVRSAPHASPSA
jgi:hypothetical protein